MEDGKGIAGLGRGKRGGGFLHQKMPEMPFLGIAGELCAHAGHRHGGQLFEGHVVLHREIILSKLRKGAFQQAQLPACRLQLGLERRALGTELGQDRVLVVALLQEQADALQAKAHIAESADSVGTR